MPSSARVLACLLCAFLPLFCYRGARRRLFLKLRIVKKWHGSREHEPVRQLVVLRVCMVVGGGQVYIFQLVAGGPRPTRNEISMKMFMDLANF